MKIKIFFLYLDLDSFYCVLGRQDSSEEGEAFLTKVKKNNRQFHP